MIGIFEHQFLLFLLVFARISMMITIGPFFMIKGIPSPVKVAITIIFSFIVFSKVEAYPIVVQTELWGFVFALIGEIFIGALIGLASSYLFTGVQFAGHIIGLDMGFAMSTFFDTSSNSTLPVLSMFLYYSTFLFYLAIDGHHYFIGAIFYSYEVLPQTLWEFSNDTMILFIKLVGDIFVIAIQVAAPVFITLFVTSVALAFISKVVPQLNIFSISFQLKIMTGMIILVVVFPIILSSFKVFYGKFERHIFELIESLIVK